MQSCPNYNVIRCQYTLNNVQYTQKYNIKIVRRHKPSQIYTRMQNWCLKWTSFNYEGIFWKDHIISFMMTNLFSFRNHSYVCISCGRYYIWKMTQTSIWETIIPVFVTISNLSPTQFQTIIITTIMFTFYNSPKNHIECDCCVSGKFVHWSPILRVFVGKILLCL